MTTYNAVVAQMESVEKLWAHDAALFVQPGMLDAYESRVSAEYCNYMIGCWLELSLRLGSLALLPPEAA